MGIMPTSKRGMGCTMSTASNGHLIEAYDTGRSQWLWRCIKCKLGNVSAIKLTALTCIPNDLRH